MEIWKEIKGYEGLYYASSNGRIKSCVRKEDAILKQNLSKNGYYKIILTKNKSQKNFCVHQLVAIAFLGHTPCKYEKVVNHIDLNKTNNNVNNLEIVSPRENSNRLHCKTSSKYTGVYKVKNSKKWSSGIMLKGKRIFLGYFDNEEDASQYYKKAVIAIEKNEPILIKNKEFTSKYKGVYWDKAAKKWAVVKKINGKMRYLGRFNNELDARDKYNNTI
jgi:hypothetical protein